MATKKTTKAAETPKAKAVKTSAKSVEKAVKTATAKIKSAVKTVAEKAETVVKAKTTAAKTSVSKAAKPAAKTVAAKPAAAKASTAKVATKTAAVKEVKKVAPVAKSAPRASEQTDVVLKSTAKRVAKVVKPAAKASKAEKATVKATQADTLPQSFDAEYLVLMQKDPNWMQAFWEVSENRIKMAKKGKGKLVLRLFDVSNDLTVKRSKKRKFRDIVVPADARSWYVENKTTENCSAALGVVSAGGKFEPLVEAAPMQTFSLKGSEVKADDVFVRASLGNTALGGFGSSGLSSMSANTWLENALNTLSSSSGSMFSGALSSAALASGSNKMELPKDSVNYGKDFFLWVKTRLIVYGGTRPDAHLQVRGEDFPLNPDGTFSFEEDLPDSTKIIPVFATDKDGDFPTTIVPIVVKRTE